MAGSDEEIGVTPHEVLGHTNLTPIRQQPVRVTLEGLNVAENIISSAAVETNRVIPELIKDFIHLEDCW